jgi:hypothetical protein
MMRWSVLLLLSCTPPANGPQSVAEGAAEVDATLSCTGAANAKWTANFKKASIDECVYRSKDAVLDLRVGTLEQGVVVHLTDFSGTGQYTIAGATGSKLAVVAQGGTGEATSTNVDTTADDPCKASCMVDVPDASVTKDGSALSIEITCSALTRVSASLCTRCVPTAKSIVRARTVPCRRE